MDVHRVGRFAILAGGLLLATAVASAAPSGTPGVVHFTAAGDYGGNAPTAGTVLQAIAAADPDLNLALGDLSYGTTGNEQAWCDFVTSRVGAGFPFELIAGNHESNGQNGNINDFSACLPNQLPGAVGTYGRQYYVDVPTDDPLVRYVMISPGITFPDSTWTYNAGSARYNWTSAAIDGARTAGIPWVVVGSHKACLSTGEYPCDLGADLTNLLLSKKVDLVLTGHEHLYQRTKQLSHGTGCTALAIGAYDADCVADSDSSLVAGAGTVFATVGTGGVGQRDVHPEDPEAPYFVTSYGSLTNPTFGFLDITATATTLSAFFQRAAGADYTDAFTFTKGPPPPNSPPTASFSSTSTGLTASFNGTGSSDSDGTITSYAWTFGDGATGTGSMPSHPYASPGTYNVTLTVTDDDGATGSVTQPVTVTTAPPVVVLASDEFTRTVSSAWGLATTGQSWSGSSGTSVGVSAGTGRLTMAQLGAGLTQNLGGVSTNDLDLKVEVSLDKLPTGGTSGYTLTLYLRKVSGQGDYRAGLVIPPSGIVRTTLTRVPPAGASQAVTLASGNAAVPAYTAGTSLTVRAQATGTSPTTMRVKVWPTGTPEPAGWTLNNITDSTAGLQVAGALGLQSYLSSSVTNAPIVSLFDNLRAARASTVP